MKILAIETSCDDTCAAIIEGKGTKKISFRIISNVISSQIEVHKKWGGVFPLLAKREHQQNLISVLSKALLKAKLLKKSKQKISLSPEKSKILNEIFSKEEILHDRIKIFLEKYQKPKIDAIAITIGPGLEPCLWAGINAAKAISFVWNIPLIPVNHIEAHIFANLIEKPNFLDFKSKIFPAICLVVSGGHTQLILMKNFGSYEIVGETRDDAAGECFDKAARVLSLGYPGGPIISTEAKKAKGKMKINLPRPMQNQANFDFSFSGLKTAILYKNLNQKNKNKIYKQEMCKEIQQAIIDVLIKKTIGAAQKYKAKTIIVGGGVSANEELRKQFGEKVNKYDKKTVLIFPPRIFSTDNAAMIGLTGYFQWLKKNRKNWRQLSAKANLTIN